MSIMRNVRLYLERLLDIIRNIEEFTEAGREAFLSEDKTQAAVIWNLEKIGFATQRIPQDVRARYPVVPWNMLAPLEDETRYQYDRVVPEDIWRTVAGELPVLKPLLEAALAVVTDDPLVDYSPPGLGIDDVLGDNRQAVLDLAAKYGASNVRVFGSVARGEATAESDVDLLMCFPPQFDLFDLVSLSQELEDLLGRPVSLVSEPITGDERFKQAVLADAVPLE